MASSIGKTICMQQVIGSSNIKAIGYDPPTKVLIVEFLPGKHSHTRTYGFTNVPYKMWAAFMSAGSHGGFFSQHIKGQFDSLWTEQEEEVHVPA